VSSLQQPPARRLLSRECAENIFIDVERARAAQLLSSTLAPAHWSSMRSHSTALLSPLLQACDLDKRFGASSAAAAPPASISSLSAAASPGLFSAASHTSRCSDDDVFLRCLRLHFSPLLSRCHPTSPPHSPTKSRVTGLSESTASSSPPLCRLSWSTRTQFCYFPLIRAALSHTRSSIPVQLSRHYRLHPCAASSAAAI
jgi:hypothetical protein